jgi:hypothetical protein
MLIPLTEGARESRSNAENRWAGEPLLADSATRGFCSMSSCRMADASPVGRPGARWVYAGDPLQAIRRDVMTRLTHHAASRQAAMVLYGRMLLG